MAATVLLILVATLAVSAVVAIVIVRRGRVRAQERLAEVPGPALRSTAATSLGLESLDAATRCAAPARSSSPTPRWPSRSGDQTASCGSRAPAIVEVDTTRSHLGKTMNSDVLRIRWTAADGEDTVAFFVRDLDPWLADLGGAAGSQPTEMVGREGLEPRPPACHAGALAN